VLINYRLINYGVVDYRLIDYGVVDYGLIDHGPPWKLLRISRQPLNPGHRSYVLLSRIPVSTQGWGF